MIFIISNNTACNFIQQHKKTAQSFDELSSLQLTKLYFQYYFSIQLTHSLFVYRLITNIK